MKKSILGILTCCFLIFDLCYGVSPTHPIIEKKVWKKIDSQIKGSRPINLIYPYPNKFQKWLDDIELNLKKAESLKDIEDKCCFYYYLDQEIISTSLPVDGFPKVIERLEILGLPFKYSELAGGYTYQYTLRKKVIEEFNGTVCAELAILRNLSRGENYDTSKMTIQVILDANKLLSIDSLSLEEKALALFYLAEAYETEWFSYVYPGQSGLADFDTKSKREARKRTLQSYKSLANIESLLQDHALKKVKSIEKGEIPNRGKYNVFE